MWCKGCQRGQKPTETGQCPDCKMLLIDLGVDIIPEKVKDEIVTTQKVKIPPRKQNFGGGYTDDNPDEPGEKIGEVVVELPSDELPKEDKPKSKMSEETKAKIKATIARKKAENK